MNRWDIYFGSPADVVNTFDDNGECVMMEIFHKECTADANVINGCPLYNRCSLDSQIEWLKDEVD